MSLPSKLVEQRPDIRAYGALLHSATAKVGVATANMLPNISLTASYRPRGRNNSGSVHAGRARLDHRRRHHASRFSRAARCIARRQAAKAALDVAAAQYSSTVNTAFQNVANALVAIERDAETLQAALAAQKTAAASLAVARSQYAAGAGTYLNVLTAEQADYTPV